MQRTFVNDRRNLTGSKCLGEMVNPANTTIHTERMMPVG